jgi:hypothetical protein
VRDYLQLPALQQVFATQRVRELPGQTEEATVYGITSLTPQQASQERLLALLPGHWGIHNHLHGVRDVMLGEGTCGVRSGSAP